MKRRDFIAGLGSAAAWPVLARAQPGDRVRRIGMLMAYPETDPEWKRRYYAFTQALADLGWTNGCNVRMDLRWYGGDDNWIRALAQELVGLQPDIIVTGTTVATAAVWTILPRIRLTVQSAAGPRLTPTSMPAPIRQLTRLRGRSCYARRSRLPAHASGF
jgi:hypothetical protein